MMDPARGEPTGSVRIGSGPSPVVVMRLTGFLDAEQVLRATSRANGELDRLGEGRLLVDCVAMTDYEGEARRLFTEWNAKNKHRVLGVAVVTDKLLWHMVVSTIGLASSQTMKAFGDIDDAHAWLSKLGMPRPGRR